MFASVLIAKHQTKCFDMKLSFKEARSVRVKQKIYF